MTIRILLNEDGVFSVSALVRDADTQREAHRMMGKIADVLDELNRVSRGERSKVRNNRAFNKRTVPL